VLLEGSVSDTANPLPPQQKSENYETNPMRDAIPTTDTTR
jgi:hypothetical protein